MLKGADLAEAVLARADEAAPLAVSIVARTRRALRIPRPARLQPLNLQRFKRTQRKALSRTLAPLPWTWPPSSKPTLAELTNRF